MSTFSLRLISATVCLTDLTGSLNFNLVVGVSSIESLPITPIKAILTLPFFTTVYFFKPYFLNSASSLGLADFCQSMFASNKGSFLALVSILAKALSP